MKQIFESLVQRVKTLSHTDSPQTGEGSGLLYVIVHDSLLYGNDYDDEKRTPIREEIARIRREENYREIREYDFPDRLPKNMPPPSENLTVYVVGGYIDLCVAFQLDTLRNGGYSAEIHSKGCF